MLTAVIFAFLVGSVFSAYTSGKQPGQCPEFTGFPTFEAAKTEGEWFYVYKTPYLNKEFKCSKTFVTAYPDGVLKSYLRFYEVGNPTLQTKNFTSTPVPGKTAAYTTEFVYPEGVTPIPEAANVQEKIAYALDTDYVNYISYLKCVNYKSNEYSLFGSIASRSPNISEEYLTKARAAFTKADVNIEFKPIDQTDCQY